MYDILIANPDESKKESMLLFLATKADPMPENMINAMRNAVFSVTARTQTEASISFYSGQRMAAASQLTRHFMTSPQTQHQDSVKLWLSRQEHLEAEMALVDYWLHQNNTSEAGQVLYAIPQHYQLSAEQQVEYNYFRLLKTIQVDLIDQGKSVFDLDESGIETIADIATNSRGLARQQSQNILNYGFGYELYDEPIYPVTVGQERLFGDEKERLKNNIYAFPNPASDQVHFHYQLDQIYQGLTIKIFDSKGMRIKEIPIAATEAGFVTWNSNAAPSGFYFYSIMSNGHALKTGKLVIAK